MAEIPIIGQPARLIHWTPISIVQCLCKTDMMQLIIITGFNNLVICPQCAGGHRIVGFGPDGPVMDYIVKAGAMPGKVM